MQLTFGGLRSERYVGTNCVPTLRLLDSQIYRCMRPFLYFIKKPVATIV